MVNGHPTPLAASRAVMELHAEPSALGITAAGFVALSMLVVVGIMLWKKVPQLIAGLLDARIAEVRQQLDEASRLRAEAEAMLTAAKQRTANQHDDAAAIVAHAQAEATALLAKAEVDAGELMQRREQMATDKIATAERQAIAEVRAKAADAAAKAAGQIIATGYGPDADRKMVDRTIAGLGRLN